MPGDCPHLQPPLLFHPECADPNLAISAIWTFRDLGVREASLLILLSPCLPSPYPDRAAEGSWPYPLGDLPTASQE